METQKRSGLPTGFVGDRKIRPAQFFQLDVAMAGRNFIHIWLPEGVSTAQGKLFFVPGGEPSGTWELHPDGGVRCRRTVGGGLRMDSIVEEVDFGALLTLRLTNETGELLQRVSAPACVQLAAAPDLRDSGLQRTFWRCGGQWERFTIAGRPQGGRCLFYGHDRPVDLPLVVVSSATGPYAAGLIFRGATSVSGNCQGAIDCIHSNVPPADITVSASRELQGYLIIHPAGRDAVLEVAQDFVSDE